MAQQISSSREQQLRMEWSNQRMTGIPNYSTWLEQKVIAAETDKNFAEMAAQENYRCWQDAEARYQNLMWNGD